MACVIAALLLATTFPAHGDSSSLPEGLIVDVIPINQTYEPDEQVLVKVVYKNVSLAPIRVLLWHTVLEGRVDVDFVELMSPFGRLHYMGRHYKRSAPTSRDYKTFHPGEAVDVVVDLRSGYQIDYAGEYSFSVSESYSRGVSNLEDQTRRFSLSDNRTIKFKRTPVVQNCNASRRAELDLSLVAAEKIARIARDDLRRTPIALRPQARRYTEWFGEYKEARWNTVQENFNRIFSAVSSQVITFICDDSSTAFAYVYPNRPYDIFLGQAFWSAPRNGVDSKSGTIIHELSHFEVLGGTDDVVYGQSGS